MIRKELVAAIRLTLLTLVVTGLAYPLLTTAVAAVLFPDRAAGSLVRDGSGDAVGSELIAQSFAKPGYLQPRPSAAGEKGYDAAASSGSNLGPTSKALRERAGKELRRLLEEDPGAPGPVPAELISASASGLDPHLSPEAALWQAPRIFASRLGAI
jgi:K+-transporting ATPase ATPase C chain